jgi:hypothetical protein
MFRRSCSFSSERAAATERRVSCSRLPEQRRTSPAGSGEGYRHRAEAAPKSSASRESPRFPGHPAQRCFVGGWRVPDLQRRTCSRALWATRETRAHDNDSVREVSVQREIERALSIVSIPPFGRQWCRCLTTCVCGLGRAFRNASNVQSQESCIHPMLGHTARPRPVLCCSPLLPRQNRQG